MLLPLGGIGRNHRDSEVQSGVLCHIIKPGAVDPKRLFSGEERILRGVELRISGADIAVHRGCSEFLHIIREVVQCLSEAFVIRRELIRGSEIRPGRIAETRPGIAPGDKGCAELLQRSVLDLRELFTHFLELLHGLWRLGIASLLEQLLIIIERHDIRADRQGIELPADLLLSDRAVQEELPVKLLLLDIFIQRERDILRGIV